MSGLKATASFTTFVPSFFFPKLPALWFLHDAQTKRIYKGQVKLHPFTPPTSLLLLSLVTERREMTFSYNVSDPTPGQIEAAIEYNNFDPEIILYLSCAIIAIGVINFLLDHVILIVKWIFVLSLLALVIVIVVVTVYDKVREDLVRLITRSIPEIKEELLEHTRTPQMGVLNQTGSKLVISDGTYIDCRNIQFTNTRYDRWLNHFQTNISYLLFLFLI